MNKTALFLLSFLGISSAQASEQLLNNPTALAAGFTAAAALGTIIYQRLTKPVITAPSVTTIKVKTLTKQELDINNINATTTVSNIKQRLHQDEGFPIACQIFSIAYKPYWYSLSSMRRRLDNRALIQSTAQHYNSNTFYVTLSLRDLDPEEGKEEA